MSISRGVAAAVIAATFALSGVQAQTLADGLIPAEFPPDSFPGRQYVDSEGCVFIRAGIDGNVTWVPRVTRSRKAICGFQPTFAAPARQTVSEPQVAEIPDKAVLKSEEFETHADKTASANSGGSASTSDQAACRGGNSVSQPYVGRVDDDVRCGPQSGSKAFANRTVKPMTVTGSGSLKGQPSTARIAPRHVIETRQASVSGIYVPKGYKPAWSDDRLNPKRAHQTEAGIAQMNLVWTQTVPRKLIVGSARDK